MDWFIPADFELYEFDDQYRPGLADASAWRWFSHWDGLIGAPAEEVNLAWSDGDATVVVCTSGRPYDVTGARFRAAHLALGGDELPIADRARPSSARHTIREMERIRSAEELWYEIPATLTAGAAAQAARCDGFTIAYSLLDSSMVFMAAVGLGAKQFRVRKVQNWNLYDINAAARFPLKDLNP